MDSANDLFSNNSLCMGCLCVGRNLQDVQEDRMKRFYLDALNEIPLPAISPILLKICWECACLLKKAVQFREQVKDSFRILQSYTHENFVERLLTDVSQQPRLKIHNNPITVVTSSAEDESDVKDEVKIETYTVKVENGTNTDSDNRDVSDYCEAERQSRKIARKRPNKCRQNRPRRTCEVDVDMTEDGQRNDLGESNLVKEENNVQDSYTDCARDALALDTGQACKKSTQRRRRNGTTKLKEDRLQQSNFYVEDIDRRYKEDDTSFIDDIQSDCSDTIKLSDLNLGKKIGEVKLAERRIKKKTVEKKRLKTTETLVQRIQSNVKHRRKLPKVKTHTIKTIELTYEQMMVERSKELAKPSYIQSEFKCETCIIGFGYQNSYMEHVSTKHSPDIGNYVCPVCKTVIASVDTFTSHYKRHLRRYECTICGKRTVDRKVIQHHYESKHGICSKEYKCKICGKVSSTMDAHRYHTSSHNARVKCPQCDKTYRHRAGLINHRAAVHKLNNAFPCTVCNKIFRWKTSLKKHLELHEPKQDNPRWAAYCEECNVGFSSVCSYQRHLRISLKHVTQDQLKFTCDHCKRRFSNKTKLRDHIEEKHLNRTYRCPICAKPSKNRGCLDQHIRNVHKGRPKNKMCHFCGKGFPTKAQLESHMRSHTGERPFICEFCPTTFSQQSNLYKHNRQVHGNLNMKSRRQSIKKKDKNQFENESVLNQDLTSKMSVSILSYEQHKGFNV